MRSHLSNDEIEQLFFSSGEPASSAGLAEARAHLEGCASCRELARRHQEAAAQLQQLRAPEASRPTKDCPPASVWAELAAGGCKAGDAEEWMLHASQCGYCGPLLKDACSDEAPALSAEEESVLRGLKTSNPEWQADFARHLAATGRPQPVRGRVLDFPRLAWVAGLAAALAIAAWFGVQQWRGSDVDTLLAKAAEERRPSEARYPGAAFSEPKVERGAESSSMDLPQALLDAKALIARHLHDSPDDPKWLQAKARADLLEYHHDAAIESLKLALESQPDSPSVLTDLGIAYYQRAVSTDTALDYGNAVESFSRALAKKPDDPVALYNRALAEEKLFLYEGAMADWEHYLRVESNGPWAETGRQRLESIRSKSGRKLSELRRPVTSLGMSRTFNDGGSDSQRASDDAEAQMHMAVRQWLPLAYSTGSIGNDKVADDARAAVDHLARTLISDHDDPWLQDLIGHAGSSAFPQALADLAAAVAADDRGDYAAATPLATRAMVEFDASGNLAGELRAQEEAVYARHLLYEGAPCVQEVTRLAARLRATRYGWLQAQTSYEQANCAGLVGVLGRNAAYLEHGIEVAKQHHYPSLALRGVGFQADRAASLGDAQLSFSRATTGLAEFWQGSGDVIKGYNLYSALDTAADLMRFSRLQVLLWQEATTLAALHPDVVQRAMAHRWYADAAYLAGDTRLAKTEYAHARELFASAPQTAATSRAVMDAEIWLARLEAQQGDLVAAEQRLRRIKSAPDRAPGFGPAIALSTAMAEVQLKRKDLSEADSAVRTSLALAEWSLNSMSGDDVRQWADQVSRAYRHAVQFELARGDSQAALELWEWYKGAEARGHGLATRDQKSSEAGLPDLRVPPALPAPVYVSSHLAALRERTVITYAVFPDGIAAWSLDNRGVIYRWIPEPQRDVESKVARFYRLCADPASSLPLVRAAGQELYQLLIAPLEDHLEASRTLVFEADDALEDVPFEALVDSQGHYLIERSTVVNSLGMYWAERAHPAEPITPDSPALVVSVPAPAEEGFPPLPDADREADEVASHFHHPRVLRGREATVDAIRQQIRGAVVFHFAGHAVDRVTGSGLMLAERDPRTGRARLVDGSSFRPEDVAHLQVAVLSACNTKGHYAELKTGLAARLIRSGVPQVVITRWAADSRVSALIAAGIVPSLVVGIRHVCDFRAITLAYATHQRDLAPYIIGMYSLYQD